MDLSPESLDHTQQTGPDATCPDDRAEGVSPSALPPSGLLCQLLARPPGL